MDVTTARTFLAAATEGSFAAAARRVHASPPAVTERIKQLEHLLGTRLFERDKRGCRLTPAGRRLLDPARNLVRAWEDGCQRVALPPRFDQFLRVGGQHALWPTLLTPWLKEVTARFSNIAFRATAAAPSQLNRAIEDDDLDMTFLYDPIYRKGIQIEEIVKDRLVLATATRATAWQSNFVRIYWGETANAELTARLGEQPAPGLMLDLGVLALDWLIQTGSSGYVPERLAQHYFEDGRLAAVDDAPAIEFSPFVCWRSNLDSDLAAGLVALAKQRMGNTPGRILQSQAM